MKKRDELPYWNADEAEILVDALNARLGEDSPLYAESFDEPRSETSYMAYVVGVCDVRQNEGTVAYVYADGPSYPELWESLSTTERVAVQDHIYAVLEAVR